MLAKRAVLQLFLQPGSCLQSRVKAGSCPAFSDGATGCASCSWHLACRKVWRLGQLLVACACQQPALPGCRERQRSRQPSRGG